MLSLVSQRRALIFKGESRVEKRTAIEAYEIIERYLNAYEYNDVQMARFFCDHYTTISLMLPGEGSSCHQSRLNTLLKLYNKAVAINTQIKNMKYNYYRVTNEHGEGYIRSSENECTIGSFSFDGKAEIRRFDTNFKRFSGDVIVEITYSDFIDGFRKVVNAISKAIGL